MKRMVLTDTHVRRDGTLFLQWQKQFSEDGKTWENLDFHRTSVPPLGDIDAQIAAVDAHVKSMGFESGVDAADIARAKAFANLSMSEKLPMSDDAVEARRATEAARAAEVAEALAAKQKAEEDLAQAAKDIAEIQAHLAQKVAEVETTEKALVEAQASLEAIAAERDAGAPRIILPG